MIMNKQKVDTAPTSSELRIFGLLVGGVFLLLGLWPVFYQLSPRLWALVPAVLLIFPAMLYPAVLIRPHRIWSKFGAVLGRFNTRLILTILYFIAVLPVALILRLTGKTPLKLKYSHDTDSYREKPEESETNITEQF